MYISNNILDCRTKFYKIKYFVTRRSQQKCSLSVRLSICPSVTNIITSLTSFTFKIDSRNSHQICMATRPCSSMRTNDLDPFSRSQYYILYEKCVNLLTSLTFFSFEIHIFCLTGLVICTRGRTDIIFVIRFKMAD